MRTSNIIYRILIILQVFTISLNGCFAQDKAIVLKTLNPQSELKILAPTEKGYYQQGLIFENDKPFLAYYSNDSSILKLISVGDSKTMTIDLKKTIDTTILHNESLGDIIMLNKDSVVILFSSGHLIGIANNKLLFNKVINIEVNGHWPHHTISSFGGVSHFLYDKENNIVYVHFIAADTDRFTKEYFTNEILGAFHLGNLEIEILPVYFPDYYLKKPVGDIIDFHINRCENKLLITFLATNEGQIFDYSTMSAKKIALPKSKLDQKEPKWFKWNKNASLKDRLNQIITNRIYDNILELRDNKGFIRFYRNSIPLKNDDGTYNSQTDKIHTLMLIDTSYNLINEFCLPKDEFYNTYCTFLKDNKLYINNFLKDAQDKAYIHFDIFDLDFLQ